MNSLTPSVTDRSIPRLAFVAALIGLWLIPSSLSAQLEKAPALAGLDPVALSEGQELEGKKTISTEHGGYLYVFASKKNRKRFQKDPNRYGIQNQYCLVVPSAAARPDLHATHEGRNYIFASEECVGKFKADPEQYLKKDDG